MSDGASIFLLCVAGIVMGIALKLTTNELTHARAVCKGALVSAGQTAEQAEKACKS